MALLDDTLIQGDSKVPKYQQVIELIKSDIEQGIFKRVSESLLLMRLAKIFIYPGTL